MLFTRDHFRPNDTHRLKLRGWKKEIERINDEIIKMRKNGEL